ncbi:PH domain-containing protein [Actinoplanes sp. NPDC089786]|uniref:PH domain-containing protein n=1 Tax=Actinoplanes sp. NPDC089786 TaxID=3155185 RepID=UPI0034443244
MVPETEAWEIRPPQHRVDRRFIVWQTLVAVLWSAGVLGVLGAIHRFAEVTRPWLGPVLIVLAVLLAVQILVAPTARYLVHRWQATDDAVYALEGWLTRRWQIVPISRIQSIDTRSGRCNSFSGWRPSGSPPRRPRARSRSRAWTPRSPGRRSTGCARSPRRPPAMRRDRGGR